MDKIRQINRELNDVNMKISSEFQAEFHHKNTVKMSTNIRVKRKCEYCKKEFTAQTIRTRYCSHQCNSRAYKKIKSEEKIEGVKRAFQVNPTGKLDSVFDYSTIQNKELLTIKETCAFLSITHVTLRRWLKNGVIHSSRIGKKHLIKRIHLDHLIT
jgi:excisionase family DNA binding protein